MTTVTLGVFDYDFERQPGHRAWLEGCGPRPVVFVRPDRDVVERKGRRPYYAQAERVEHLRRRGYDARPLPEGRQAQVEAVLAAEPKRVVLCADTLAWWPERGLLARVPERVAVRPRVPTGVSTTQLLRAEGLLEGLRV